MAAKAKKIKTQSSEPVSLQAIAGFVTDDEDKHQKLLGDRVRLGILSSLAVQETPTFHELKGLLAVSDGNLSTHARKLEGAEYISCQKSFEDRTPKTRYQLTTKGLNALKRHLQHMEALINVTKR